MSKFLSADSIKINDVEYVPENGVVTIPDESDLIAVNRLGLSRYIEAPASAAEHAQGGE